jgi:hypothetical protein
VARCRKNSTSNRFRNTVSTVKKSQDEMPRARAVRNWVHVGPVRRGARATPARFRIFHTVLATIR